MNKIPLCSEEEWNRLIRVAWAVREQAYAPYSGFRVGAALRVQDGTLFTGCNVENISYGLTLCAERAAVVAAVSAGQREFTSIAIVSESGEPVSPCGACRQVLAEFNPDLEIRSVNHHGHALDANLSELFPRPKMGILG